MVSCRLTTLREALSAAEVDVTRLLDNPLLHQLMDMQMPSLAVAVVHSKVEILHVKCQDISAELDQMTSDLRGKMAQQRAGILADLEGIEEWLGDAYSAVLLEPNRLLYPPNLVDEGSLKPRSEDSSVLGEEEEEWSRGSGVGEGSPPREQSNGEHQEMGEGAQEGVAGDEEEGVAGEEESVAGVHEGMADGDEGVADSEDSMAFQERSKDTGDEGVNGMDDDLSPSQTATMTSGEGSSEMDQSQSEGTGMRIGNEIVVGECTGNEIVKGEWNGNEIVVGG